MFRNAQCIYQLNHVHFTVTANEGAYVLCRIQFIVVGNKHQRLDGLLHIHVEVVAYILDGLGSRSVYALQFFHLFLNRFVIYAFRSLQRCRISAFRTVCQFTLSHVRQCGEFVRTASADWAVVRFYNSVVQSAASEDSLISTVLVHVADIHSRFISVEGISVAHQELSGTQQSVSWTSFVSVLPLNLVQGLRKLSVGREFVPCDIRYGLLMRRSKAEVSSVSVLDSPQFRSVCIPSAGFLPQFGRIRSRHQDFLVADAVQFLPDDILYLPQGTVSQRHEFIDSRCYLANQVGTNQQLMADQFRFLRCFSQCLQMSLG